MDLEVQAPVRTNGAVTGRGAATRARILEAAGAELVETGDLEVTAVAARAGVSAGLPYRYFGTRSGLLVAVVDDFYERLGRAAVYRRYDEETWAGRERRRIADWVAFLYADPLSPVIIGGLVGDGEVAAANATRLREAIAVGARNVARAQEDGQLPTGRDPGLLVAAMLGGTHSAVAEALGRRPRPAADDVAAELWRCVAGAAGIDADQQPLPGGQS
ncbi:MAG: TetR/AcrR family transcriptional regulator [Actinomycetota bacterium]|nr:TetR/AcrR family transcriptional regulator [Actinomycetota bacterium]